MCCVVERRSALNQNLTRPRRASDSTRSPSCRRSRERSRRPKLSRGDFEPSCELVRRGQPSKGVARVAMPSRPARHGETKSAGVGFVCSPVREIASCEKPPCAIGADDALQSRRNARACFLDRRRALPRARRRRRAGDEALPREAGRRTRTRRTRTRRTHPSGLLRRLVVAAPAPVARVVVGGRGAALPAAPPPPGVRRGRRRLRRSARRARGLRLSASRPRDVGAGDQREPPVGVRREQALVTAVVMSSSRASPRDAPPRRPSSCARPRRPRR